MGLPYKISNTVRAESELESAINYYQEVANDRVAENFINEFVKILYFIKHFPFQRIYKDNLRGVLMKKYPYIVFYVVDDIEREIIIKGVFNTYQDVSKYPE
ncbi:type II toxin-antitoxin system RelE/ParE family toxin [Capnocytophaga sp. oral taxon 903]|uniref:type II toxin-antitoxin system RelE/ParE family toxin n=1 Tax=Capnocytophaga sp. oral taxon 903 TaxID=2748317 RepID=UPI0015BE0386|nr:type II toxin-antitoxin system RelE/ParE family toxin [Capnocytophaga sp. oral taxon 903]NWO28482.1 type II toxin-antitoxin system RelE/ParE family toxin [Capnocytophaga sp. oral taxon 903]